MITEEQAENYIFLKLLHHKFIGGRHTNERNIAKGVRPEDIRQVSKALQRLEKGGFLIRKPKPDGTHISLSPGMVSVAVKLLEERGEVLKQY